jgi:hypothetical protein
VLNGYDLVVGAALARTASPTDRDGAGDCGNEPGKNRRSRLENDLRDDEPTSRTRSLLLQIAKSLAPDGELPLSGPLLGCFGYLLGLSTATTAEATAVQTPISRIPEVQIFRFSF